MLNLLLLAKSIKVNCVYKNELSKTLFKSRIYKVLKGFNPRPEIHFLSPCTSFLKMNLPISFSNAFWIKNSILIFLWINIWKHFLDEFSINSTINNHMSNMDTLWTSKILILDKVIYPKYSKHWSYNVKSWFKSWVIFLLFKLIPCPIHWIVYVLVYLNFIFEF